MVSTDVETSKGEEVINPSRFQVADWQEQDIQHLAGREWSANWSEMG